MNNSKIKLLAITFFICLSSASFAQKINLDSLNSHNAFKVGETLIYSVKYHLIRGGIATLSLNLFQNGDGYVYYAKAEAKTTGTARLFANIYDTYESYFDLFTGYPVRATRTIHENHYWYYNDVIFNQDSGYVWSLRSGRKKVPTPILDFLSAYYFARKFLFNRQFKKGQIIDLTTYFEDHVFPLKIKYKKTTKIHTKFGRVQALMFVPALDAKDNPFKKEDDLKIYFSDDGNYIPLKVVMHTKFGNVKAVLIKYQNLNYPFGIPYKEYLEKMKQLHLNQ